MGAVIIDEDDAVCDDPQVPAVFEDISRGDPAFATAV